MTPLSWHTWAGNLEIIKLLLENGAAINDDFDHRAPTSDSVTKITVMDVISITLQSSRDALSSSPEDNKGDLDSATTVFQQTYDFLRSRGALTWNELSEN